MCCEPRDALQNRWHPRLRASTASKMPPFAQRGGACWVTHHVALNRPSTACPDYQFSLSVLNHGARHACRTRRSGRHACRHGPQSHLRPRPATCGSAGAAPCSGRNSQHTLSLINPSHRPYSWTSGTARSCDAVRAAGCTVPQDSILFAAGSRRTRHRRCSWMASTARGPTRSC